MRFVINEPSLPAGEARFFRSGTGTAKSVYSDPLLTTSLGVTVTLDDSGYAQVWLDGLYRVELADADGVVLRTLDAVGLPALQRWSLAAAQDGTISVRRPLVQADNGNVYILAAGGDPQEDPNGVGLQSWVRLGDEADSSLTDIPLWEAATSGQYSPIRPLTRTADDRLFVLTPGGDPAVSPLGSTDDWSVFPYRQRTVEEDISEIRSRVGSLEEGAGLDNLQNLGIDYVEKDFGQSDITNNQDYVLFSRFLTSGTVRFHTQASLSVPGVQADLLAAGVTVRTQIRQTGRAPIVSRALPAAVAYYSSLSQVELYHRIRNNPPVNGGDFTADIQNADISEVSLSEMSLPMLANPYTFTPPAEDGYLFLAWQKDSVLTELQSGGAVVAGWTTTDFRYNGTDYTVLIWNQFKSDFSTDDIQLTWNRALRRLIY